MKAIVNAAVCPLKAEPQWESTLADEVLYGMVVDILEEAAPGWVRVRTHYRYEGYAPKEQLIVCATRTAATRSPSPRCKAAFCRA